MTQLSYVWSVMIGTINIWEVADKALDSRTVSLLGGGGRRKRLQ